jgi:hypothetical protein
VGEREDIFTDIGVVVGWRGRDVSAQIGAALWSGYFGVAVLGEGVLLPTKAAVYGDIFTGMGAVVWGGGYIYR